MQQRTPAPQPKTVSLLVHLALLGALGVLAMAPAHADSGSPAHYRQNTLPLADALNRVARQAGITLSVDAALVQGKQAPALNGSYSPEAALRALLAGSGLQLLKGSDGNYAVRAANVQSEAPLDTIRVSAAANVAAETATSPVRGYVAKRSAAETKTDTLIVETPQSVSMVGAEEIKAIRATNMVETLAYTPGVINNYGFDPSTINGKRFRAAAFWGSQRRASRPI